MASLYTGRKNGKPTEQTTGNPAVPSPGNEHTSMLIGSVPDVPVHGGEGGGDGAEPDRGDRDCGQELRNCKSVARLRFKAAFKECAGKTAAGLAACATACAFTGPYYIACVGVCGAGVIANEYFCMSAANDNWEADRITCGTLYDQCCAENWCPPNE